MMKPTQNAQKHQSLESLQVDKHPYRDAPNRDKHVALQTLVEVTVSFNLFIWFLIHILNPIFS